MVFCDWLLSLCTMFSSLIHVAACISASLHYMSKWYWTDHILLISLLFDGHLGCFHFGAIMNMNIHILVVVWAYFFTFLVYISRSRITGSCNSLFKRLRNSKPVFPSSCTIVPFHKQCVRFPFLHILTNTCLFDFSNSNSYDVVFLFNFDLHFPDC